MPFPQDAAEEDERVPSPLDEIFALLEFDIDVAKTSVIDIDLVESILDLIILKLGLLDPSSLLSFCDEILTKKGKESAKTSAMFITLLMEICSEEAVHCTSSSNMSNVMGVRG